MCAVMIKINEEKLRLFQELRAVSNWSKKMELEAINDKRITGCNLSILELLETRSGRIQVIKITHKFNALRI
jgi:hypothetical protein